MTNEVNKKSDTKVESPADAPMEIGDETSAAPAPDPMSGGDEPGIVPEADTFLILQQIEEIRVQAAKAEENWAKFLRVTADFDNYKKRASRELQDGLKFANQDLLQKLIPVLDNFEAALAAASSADSTNAESLKTGVTMIMTQLKGILNSSGLEEVDATGQPFNPNLHEAVSQLESSDVQEGHVLQQLRKGYRLKDRLLRPATVVVAKKPVAA